MEQNWRAGLAQDSRNKIVDRIMDTLQRHTPLLGQDGMIAIWKIANRFEEKIFYSASDQHDYLKKISLKMVSLETRTENVPNGALPSSSSGTSCVRPLLGCVDATEKKRIKLATEQNWRARLAQDSRNKIVNRIIDTLQRHTTLLGQDEIWNTANRIEEKIFYSASDQHDYLRKISLKMLNIETRTRNAPNGALTSSSSGTSSVRPLDSGKELLACGDVTEEKRNKLTMEQNWRSALAQDTRNKIINRIMDALQRQTTLLEQMELQKIANKFEEKIFYAASDQHDYLRKISLKMLNLETRSQNAPNGDLPSRSSGTSSVRPLDSGKDFLGCVDATEEKRNNLAIEQNWQAGLAQDSRNRIVNRIMDTLQRHTTLSGQDELWKIANGLEENIFYTASDQHDYLRKISLEVLNLETRTQNAPNGALPLSSSGTISVTPLDSGKDLLGCADATEEKRNKLTM